MNTPQLADTTEKTGLYFYDAEFLFGLKQLAHGFFGRIGGVSNDIYDSLNCALGSDDHQENVLKNRSIVLKELGLSGFALQTLRQIHSADVHTLETPWDELQRPEGDAMVTDRSGLALGVLSADCAPVLFYGEKEDGSPVIGAAHAGWKGALRGVLHNTVNAMLDLGAQSDTIRAAIGPSIGPESYEVGSEFKIEFEKKDSSYSKYFRKFGSADYFDLISFCHDRLREAGARVSTQKAIDTFFHEEDFFSYRRATHRHERGYGRQISVIAIR